MKLNFSALFNKSHSYLIFYFSLIFLIAGIWASEYGPLEKTPGSTQRNVFSADEIEKMKINLQKRAQLPENLFIIGHRGMGATNNITATGPKADPENTLGSFKQAIILGVDGIEFDIFETQDGHLLVIHNDELWKNVYSSGLELPPNETEDTFRVSKKNISELAHLSVGANGQKPPLLTEVFHLVEEANSIRAALEEKPLLLNIDIKNPPTALKCFEEIERQLKEKPDSTINFSTVYFTSPNRQTLCDLSKRAHEIPVHLVPQVSTQQIYGKENVDEQYNVKDIESYDKQSLSSLQQLIENNPFIGIDCILWDMNYPLLLLCLEKKLQLHLYASNFNGCSNFQDFAAFIISISQLAPLYLKTDAIEKTIAILNLNANGSIPREKQPRLMPRLPLDKPKKQFIEDSTP